LLIIGTGPDLFPLAIPLREALRRSGVKPEVMNTGAAVRTYNVLFAENRAVAGAFFAVI
ncbi:MAG: Mth938-like domain-containing protein, partial [Hyphomicrobiales bacterium]|nr:Mth938-like domain-containing protein [Hyphomicrobiales bacterium]